MSDKAFRHATFNLAALLALAGELRGQRCTCDRTAAPKTGSMNWVIFVSFDDGLDWVFRSPRTGIDSTVSDNSASKMLLSEVATLKLLGKQTAVPVPEVFSFSASCDNPIGIPYILMSKATGRPLSDYEWVSVRMSGYPQRVPLLPLPDAAKIKVMRQLGGFMRHLSALRFEKIGSLFEEPDGNVLVGECLTPALVWQHRDSLTDGAVQRGPFLHEGQYLEALTSALIAHAKELPLTPHTFFAPIPEEAEYPTWPSYTAAVERWNDYVEVGAKIESSNNILHFCLAGQILRQMIPRLSAVDGSYTLSHPDLHSGNIFVDADFNVTCLIDWSSASTGPLSELLTTPRIQTLPPQPLIIAFRQAFDAEHLLPSDSWERASMRWYYSRLVRLVSKNDLELFKALYSIVYKVTVDDGDITTLFNRLAADKRNQELLKELRTDDFTTSELKEHEASRLGYLGNKNDRRAVARKLTVMAELNRHFVTSVKLWRWIEAAMQT
ncbi:hypothetical protein V2A60_002448 [Cordyceps javanica]